MAQPDTSGVAIIQVFRQLTPVVVLDPFRGQPQGVKRFRLAGFFSGRNLLFGEAHLLRRKGQAVETLGVAEDGCVAFFSHCLQDVGDGPIDLLGGLASHLQEGAEGWLEVRRARVEFMGHVYAPETDLSSARPLRAGS